MDILENGVDSEYLFDKELLKLINWENKKSSFKGNISPDHPGEHLLMRPLQVDDFDKGYLQLMEQLTIVGELDKRQFTKRFQEMKASAGTYYVIVIEDCRTRSVIGSTTLVVEKKFIHSAGTRGRIEDVVVNSEYRGQQLGKLLVEAATLLGKSLGCYKMSLECKDDRVKFYQTFGYSSDGQNFMFQRYKD